MHRAATLVKWPCSLALTIWQRQTHAALASLGWRPEARGAGGGGPLVPEKPASCWARCEGRGGSTMLLLLV